MKGKTIDEIAEEAVEWWETHRTCITNPNAAYHVAVRAVKTDRRERRKRNGERKAGPNGV